MAMEVVMELNNMAVEMHGEGLFNDAAIVYNDAIGALSDILAATCENSTRSTGSIAHNTVSTRNWSIVLEDRKEEARKRGANNSMSPTDVNAAAYTNSSVLGTGFGNHYQSSSRQGAVAHTGMLEPLILTKSNMKVSKDTTKASSVLLFNMSLCQAFKGELRKAQQFLEMSMGLQTPSSNEEGPGPFFAYLKLSSRYNMALLHQSQGNNSDAFRWIHDALVLGLEYFGSHALVASVLHTLGHLFLLSGDSRGANESFLESRRMFDRLAVEICNVDASMCKLGGSGAAAA